MPGLEDSFKQDGMSKLLSICLACVNGDPTLRIRSKDAALELVNLKATVASFHWRQRALSPALEPAAKLNFSTEAKSSGRNPTTADSRPDPSAQCQRRGGRRSGRGGRDRAARAVNTNNGGAQRGAHGKKRQRGGGVQPNDATVESVIKGIMSRGGKKQRRRRTSNVCFREEIGGEAIVSRPSAHDSSAYSGWPVSDHIKREDEGATQVDAFVVPENDLQ